MLLLHLMVRLLAIDPDEYCKFSPHLLSWFEFFFLICWRRKKFGTCSGGLGTFTIQQGVGHPQPTDESCYQCMERSTDESRFAYVTKNYTLWNFKCAHMQSTTTVHAFPNQPRARALVKGGQQPWNAGRGGRGGGKEGKIHGKLGEEGGALAHG